MTIIRDVKPSPPSWKSNIISSNPSIHFPFLPFLHYKSFLRDPFTHFFKQQQQQQKKKSKSNQQHRNELQRSRRHVLQHRRRLTSRPLNQLWCTSLLPLPPSLSPLFETPVRTRNRSAAHSPTPPTHHPAQTTPPTKAARSRTRALPTLAEKRP